jgi:hypothetical protein
MHRAEDGRVESAPGSPSATTHHRHIHKLHTAAHATSAAAAAEDRQLHDPVTGHGHSSRPAAAAAAHQGPLLSAPAAATVIIDDSNSHTGARSVYELLTKRKRYAVLLAAAIASILVPLTGTNTIPGFHACL